MKKPLSLAILTALASLTLVSCHSDNDSTPTTTTPTAPTTPTPARFNSVDTSPNVNGGEILIDSTNNISWINDTTLDPNGDGCVSPGNVGPIEVGQAFGRCTTQTFGGFNDWRAPTAAELTDLIESATAAGVAMNYLVAACPALVGTDGVVRTENDNAAVTSSSFANVAAGGLLADTFAGLNGAFPAGVRCVRDGIEETPQSRFTFARAEAANDGSKTLIDTVSNLEWINQVALDSNGDGCVSPGAVGPTDPSADPALLGGTQSRCEDQQFAGHDDWRAPTADELSTIIITTSTTSGVSLKYLIAGCPANVSTTNYVRTENGISNSFQNAAVAAAFPNATTGDELSTTQAGMTVNGNSVPSGVRCVRDITTP